MHIKIKRHAIIWKGHSPKCSTVIYLQLHVVIKNSYLHLFPVSGGLVQGLQPHITQSQHRVGVILCGWLLQNTLKLLLTGSPLLFGQVKVPNQ